MQELFCIDRSGPRHPRAHLNLARLTQDRQSRRYRKLRAGPDRAALDAELRLAPAVGAKWPGGYSKRFGQQQLYDDLHFLQAIAPAVKVAVEKQLIHVPTLSF